MNAKKTFRVAVLGTPQTEQWLLVRAFAATRDRRCVYELVDNSSDNRPDMYVVDAEHDSAIARWVAQDSRGAVPAAFFGRVHPRAKSAVVVSRPHTSGSVVDALDQLTRRFLEVAETTRPPFRAGAREMALAA
jgi:hypothetical protein